MKTKQIDTLTFKFGGIIRIPNIRRLYDIQDVIYDTKWALAQKNFELYYMYRDLYKNNSDYETIKKKNLRYDITIIPPKMLGIEFVKTAGHCHPLIDKSDLSYTEVYQVLEGSATYLLQKIDEKSGEIEDVVVIKAKKGDNVIIPPNYGHITINESKEFLKMANWVYRDFSSEYDLIKKKKGGAYFLTLRGFIKNPEYRDVPEIRYLKPTNFANNGFKQGVDMYNLIYDADKLNFLKNPANFNKLFDKIIENKI